MHFPYLIKIKILYLYCKQFCVNDRALLAKQDGTEASVRTFDFDAAAVADSDAATHHRFQ